MVIFNSLVAHLVVTVVSDSIMGEEGGLTQLKINGGTIFYGAVLEGKIVIGTGTVVHPGAVIKATNGEIIFGEYNIVEETAVIENRNADGSPMAIGNENTFKAKSQCYATSMGDGNVISTFAKVGEGATLTNNCFIGPYGLYGDKGQPMQENTVIYNGNKRRISTEPAQSTRIQADLLKRQLSSFHKVIKPKTDAGES